MRVHKSILVPVWKDVAVFKLLSKLASRKIAMVVENLLIKIMLFLIY